jgi:4-hydroxybenzoate polyprenyltransferase
MIVGSIKSKLNLISELLILKQTIFALPFAYIGLLLAGLTEKQGKQLGIANYKIWILVTLAMIGARTAGMSLNRIIDRKIDSENPRTKNRILPEGRMKVSTVWALAIFSLALLFLCAYFLNPLCFYLSPLAALLLFGYSYSKRFTWFSHFVLGIVEAFAPIGGWFAYTGEFHWVPIILGVLILFWMVGLDIIYACQDYQHDKKVGLYSIPSRFGLKQALLISKIAHFICMICIVVTGFLLPLGIAYWVGAFIVGCLFFYEHSIVSPNDLSKVPVAFFKVNSWIAILLAFFIGLDVILSKGTI